VRHAWRAPKQSRERMLHPIHRLRPCHHTDNRLLVPNSVDEERPNATARRYGRRFLVVVGVVAVFASRLNPVQNRPQDVDWEVIDEFQLCLGEATVRGARAEHEHHACRKGANGIRIDAGIERRAIHDDRIVLLTNLCQHVSHFW